MRRPRGRAGFTLVELMIVIAIIGILSAIAIPSFQRLQLRSKVSEARTNLAGIRVAEEGYFVEFGTYLGAGPAPPVLPGTNKSPWVLGTAFDQLGWAPTGPVQFQYQVTIAPAPSEVFTAEAFSDLDGDGAINAFGYVREHPNGGAEVAGTLCPDTGVWDPALGINNILDTVGPCDALSGIRVF